jgi:hypothetical protein
MNYFVKRGTEQLGPFSLADLQKQVQAGKISLGDLAQSEGMNDWAMVSQVIGTIAVPAPVAYGAVQPAVEPVAKVELPPNLHWLVILLMNIVSNAWPVAALFNMGWMLMLANWARKLNGNVNTLVLVAMYPAGIIAGAFAGAVNRDRNTGGLIGALLIIGGVIAFLIGTFKIKGAMEEYYNSTENIGLRLSGVMTFFFSTVYLQYWVNELHKRKKSATLTQSA